MKIAEKFSERPLISFEIFPPQKDSPLSSIFKTIDELADLKADYISVTYSATGGQSSRTSEIASIIKNRYGIDPLAHITAVRNSKEDIKKEVEKMYDNNIENILVLRGDNLSGEPEAKDFKYAQELIQFIRDEYNDKFCLAGACYPEGHIEARNKSLDLYYLEKKVSSGVDFLITQLFFDNTFYYDFASKLRNRSIRIPVQAGIMPVTNKNQIERITSMCGAFIPEKFIKVMNKYQADKQALTDAGVAYATDQIIDLLSSGVDGIHLYVMNKPQVARKITQNIKAVMKSLKSGDV